jgi:hypothetical protein
VAAAADTDDVAVAGAATVADEGGVSSLFFEAKMSIEKKLLKIENRHLFRLKFQFVGVGALPSLCRRFIERCRRRGLAALKCRFLSLFLSHLLWTCNSSRRNS